MCFYFTKILGRLNHLVVCALLLFGPVTLALGQEAKTSKPRYEELPNFGRVNERLYRGGQPGKGGMHKLAALGVNTILNLRGTGKVSGIAILQCPLQTPRSPERFPD